MNKIVPAIHALENYIHKNFAQILCYLVLIIVVIMTLRLQNKIVGWEPGYDDLQPNHHGWVSSQVLSFITTATPENNFLGYAEEWKDDQNIIHYDIFDRYPVFYSAVFNRVLTLVPKLSSKITLAKLVMNLIFLGTLILAFLILDKLLKNKPLALTAALLAFSNPFLLFYKDMVHFDQPALFGFLLLIYAIALYKLDGLKLPVIIAPFIAIALGRGYASYAVLIVWLAIEAFLLLRSKDFRFGQKLLAIVKHPSFYMLLIGIVWGASLLSYNILVEARKRNIPILQTSILDSAQRRLAFNPAFNEQYEEIIRWDDFAKGQVNRIIKWMFPVNKINLGFFWNFLLLSVVFIFIGRFVRGQPLENRIIYLILVLSGFVWLFPLRNLAAFHDYTTMYYIGIPLVLFASVLVKLKPSKESSTYLVVIGLVVYLSGIAMLRDWHESRAGDANQVTYDFNRIVENIEGTGNNIYVKDAIPNGKYAARFYLSEQHLSPLALADYVIANDREFLPENLTPDNVDFFLFKK